MKSNLLCSLLFWAVCCARLGQAQTGGYLFSTLAGTPGTNGFADGTNASALFNFPGGLVADGSGNLYVSDISSHTIRKVSPVGTNWIVTTIAGQPGVPGSADGTNGSALFDRPNGLAVDTAGNVFVADHYNHTIRKLTPSGTDWIVTTIAGLAGVSGTADGTNSDARFWSPTAIVVGTNQHLYVTDTANFTVREIVPAGTNWVVSTIAGVALNFGFEDGTNGGGRFDYPYGITIDGAGHLYVADFGNNAIREVYAVGNDWVVRTIAGNSGELGSTDGPGAVARFNQPNGICTDQTGALYVTDQNNNILRKITGSGTNRVVSTIGGVAAFLGGYAGGVGNAARFKHPWGVVVDNAGVLYVADYGNQVIRQGLFLPALDISLMAGQVVLAWTSSAGAYVPQMTTALDGSVAWSPLSSMPATNGLKVTVVDQPTTAPVFYRLFKVPVGPAP